ncbi:MAG TPA: hypothetical protein VIV14_03525 [Gammaproteobacteria bacterium]
MIGWGIFIVLLILWGLAWRFQTKMAFGILIGLGLGWFLARFIGPFNSVQEIPVWLPATPLVSVVIILFVLGGLAWFLPPTDSEESDSPDSHSSH